MTHEVCTCSNTPSVSSTAAWICMPEQVGLSIPDPVSYEEEDPLSSVTEFLMSVIYHLRSINP